MFVRDGANGLPAAGEAVDFDDGFWTQGLSPDGDPIRYYNFDFQPREPNRMFVLYTDGTPVADQLPIIDYVPGDDGYSDVWTLSRVAVDAGYVANTVTSADDVRASGWSIEDTDQVVNGPVVPDGSTATMRLGDGDASLKLAWYRGSVAPYFDFSESDLRLVSGGPFDGTVPQSFIFVSFNINPGEPGGGPPSGAKTEPNSDQTHNVALTIPGDADYSPLWLVHMYDNAEFDDVTDAQSATGATFLAIPEGLVNCPIVWLSSGSD